MPEQVPFPSIAELGRRLRSGDTTARKLAETALHRLDTIGRDLNAVVCLTAERALSEGDLADQELASGIDRGPLHGIPYGAKDLLATWDYPTTWGAEPLRDQQFNEDATVVRKLQDAGAVLVAKLAMVELAGGFGYDQPNAALTGPGRCAWDRERWAGGSSSGSGSAVGAGLVPFAIGTETWGSIHCPSAFNGITGMRPTPGLVSRSGAMALSWTMDKIGPMARSVDDCALVLAAISGPDPADATTIGVPAAILDNRNAGFRIGFLRSSLDKCSPGVAANAQAAIDVLTEFASIEEIDLPELPFDDAASVLIMCEGYSAFESFIERGDALKLTAPEDRYGLYHAMQVPQADYLKALRVRTAGGQAMSERLAGLDAIIAPTLSIPAPQIAANFHDSFDAFDAPNLGGMGNLIGLPSISVPTGLENGLPTSLEILGYWWTEPTITAIAREYQTRTAWHTHRPPTNM